MFQDFTHPEVRQLRLNVAEEVSERYDVVGFEYDFMRCPGYFKYGEEEANTPLMTQLIRDTRSMLDRIGEKKGKVLGLSVRVPNTIEGALRLGLDVTDDLSGDASRVRRIRLYIVFYELTVADRVEVKLNGKVLSCINPLVPGTRCPVF